jgi:hypothetical protein
MLEYISDGGSGGGDRTPILKFSAKDGSFIAVERVQIDGQWTNQDNELTPPIKVAMDLEKLEVGYIAFMPAPDFRMVLVGERPPEKPSDVGADGKPMHKWGFRVTLTNKDVGLRELSSSSKNVYVAMQTLYAQYVAGKDENAGKVPIVEISGTERKVQTLSDGQQQTWRVPQWAVVGWTDRPAALGGAAASPAEPAAASVAPPVAVDPPASTSEGSDLFV